MLKRIRFNDWIAMQREVESAAMEGGMSEPPIKEEVDRAIKYARESSSKYKKEAYKSNKT